MDRRVVIAGGGVSALFAALRLVERGFSIELHEKMKRPGLKWLLAGSSGLNLSSSLNTGQLASRYREQSSRFCNFLNHFNPDDLNRWLESFGGGLKKGSGNRLLEEHFSAAQLLELWMKRLEESGRFQLITGSELIGVGKAEVEENGRVRLVFRRGEEMQVRTSRSALLALGGGSRAATGSDGSWMRMLREAGLACRDLVPANCGLTHAWSGKMELDSSHRYLKNAALGLPGGPYVRGDLVLTRRGMEGNAVYSLIPALRERLSAAGEAPACIDLFPDLTETELRGRLDRPRGKNSLFNFLRKQLKLDRVGFSILMELTTPKQRSGDLSALLKALPITFSGTDSIERAISCAGGLSFDELDEQLMIRKIPGLYAAGEMLDWEAPTGGFLFQGCFSTAAVAADAIASDGTGV